jgi:hypothetical protein
MYALPAGTLDESKFVIGPSAHPTADGTNKHTIRINLLKFIVTPGFDQPSLTRESIANALT